MGAYVLFVVLVLHHQPAGIAMQEFDDKTHCDDAISVLAGKERTIDVVDAWCQPKGGTRK